MTQEKNSIIDVSVSFEEMLRPQSLLTVFNERFSESATKGIDRLSGYQYAHRAMEDVGVVALKCGAGTFRFSPYLETLKLKGRGQPPRLIAIPTIRDRLVLHQLNKILAQAFPESVPRNIANAIVRDIAADLPKQPVEKTFICGCDIKKFYDSIKRERLLKTIQKRINHKRVMSLIAHALLTPTVPKNSRHSQYRSFRTDVGIPQGLAISNILAAIYLRDVDVAMSRSQVSYYRYVDDVLMYGEELPLREAQRALRRKLSYRGLLLHLDGSGKSHLGRMDVPFGYLGYRFVWPKITVRETTVERLLQSIAAKFSDYHHNSERRLKRFKYLTTTRQKETFLLELNERITGAISENRRYGWIAYFSQINDLSLLHKLDKTVASMFRRLPEFGRKAPSGLRKFARAYYEMKFNPKGGYVRDYDAIVTRAAKLEFLLERGRIDPEEELTDDQLDARFASYRRHVLAAMHADEGTHYG